MEESSTNISISIIVAIYNSSPTLKRCLNSVVGQTFKDFEVLLVDDGSTDSSADICRKYVGSDSRFRYFYKSNGGVASAREYGLSKAVGRYIIHVDPDDWIEPDMIESMYQYTDEESYDAVVCDFYMEHGEWQEYVSQRFTGDSGRDVLRLLVNGKLHGSCWNKLIRKNIICDNGVHFQEGINRWEDLLFNIRVFSSSNISARYLPRALYHYVFIQGKFSLANNYSVQSFYYQKHAIEWMENLKKEKKLEIDLTMLKASTKQLAFKSNALSAKELVELYPEVNGYLQQSSDFTSRLMTLEMKLHIRKPFFYFWKCGAYFKSLIKPLIEKNSLLL